MRRRARGVLRSLRRLALAALVLAPSLARAAPGVPEGFEPPVVTQTADFIYPPALAELDAPPAGRVLIQVTIGIDGIPKDLQLIEGVHPEIDALALQAVAQLRFSPATVKGQPVEVEQQVPIRVEPPERATTAPSDADPPTPDDPDAAATDDEPEPEAPPPDLGPVRIHGRITEAGQRTPIAGASILVVPARPDQAVGVIKKKDYRPAPAPAWEIGTTTDADGRFTLASLPEGALKVHIIVLAAGFERAEAIASVPAGTAASVAYTVDRLAENPYRTVVESKVRAQEEVAQRSITVGEINALPGTQGDALKAIQNFPGVARSPFGAGFLAIRGTGPNDSAVFLGHHEIPTLFHFGGLTSVFNSDILERIDFVPGNFDSRYGDAIGGIIAVTPRKGRRDGFHGYVDSDIFDTGVLAEGPVGKGSWALSGRRSYIDLILPLAIPDDAGLDFSVAPRYYDYQGLFDYPIAGGDFTIRAFGSDDRTKLVLTAPNDGDEETDDLRDQIETTNFFHRFDLAYEKRQGPWRFLVTPSYRYEQFNLGLLGILDFDLSSHNVSMRSEIERRFGARHSWRIGTEYTATWFLVDVEAPPIAQAGGGMGSTDERTSTRVRDTLAVPAVYTTLTLGVTDSFRLLPGARVGYYTALDRAGFVDPRVRFAWDLADRTTLNGGTGLYSQAPQPVEYSTQFGNPNLGLTRGIQNSVGVSQGFAQDLSLDATTFFNYIYDQPALSTEVTRTETGGLDAERFANTQIGRVYGLEVLLRRQSTGAFYGWLAYTLSRSERRPAPGEPWRLFGFDQTHILTLIGVYRLPKGWQVGARFRLVSGNPRTPVGGSVYDASRDFYIPINGPINSERVPPFHQLDLRVDKKWTWKVVSMTLYLDVQNAYNRQNPEFFIPSFDYSQESVIPSLPIIPSIGTKLEW